MKANGYSEPSSGSVYALAPPDLEPLPKPTRRLIVWSDGSWAEIDPETGEVLEEGGSGAGASRDEERGDARGAQ